MRESSHNSKSKSLWLWKGLAAVAVVFLLGNACGWYLNRRTQVAYQQQVVAEVDRLGGVYYYDYQLLADGALAKDAPLSWVGQTLGVDWTHDIFYITFAEFSTTEQGQVVATSRESISDEFVALAAKLPSLRWIALNGTGVSDAGIAQLCRRCDIEKLWLGQTSITDSALEAIGACPSVELLAIEATNTTDAGIASLVSLPGLATLSLGSPHFTPAGLAVVGEIGSLQELHLDLLPVTDEVMQQVAKLVDLRTLSLSRTAISNRSGSHIAKLKSLRSLNLDFTQIDQGFFQGVVLPELEELSVVGTLFTGAGLEGLVGCGNVSTIDARGTSCSLSELSQFFEVELGRSPELFLAAVAETAVDSKGRLVSLDLSGYQFTDDDLEVLDGHAELQWLKLPGNSLTADGYRGLATIPLPALRLLDVSQSGLTDQGLQYVLELKQLVNLHVANTAVSAQQIEQASSSNPGMTIYAGHLEN